VFDAGTNKEELIPEMDKQGYKQFVMMCSTPAHEAKFMQHAKEAPVKNAFHGSPVTHLSLRPALRLSSLAPRRVERAKVTPSARRAWRRRRLQTGTVSCGMGSTTRRLRTGGATATVSISR
jgi:hypothetical protein